MSDEPKVGQISFSNDTGVVVSSGMTIEGVELPGPSDREKVALLLEALKEAREVINSTDFSVMMNAERALARIDSAIVAATRETSAK